MLANIVLSLNHWYILSSESYSDGCGVYFPLIWCIIHCPRTELMICRSLGHHNTDICQGISKQFVYCLLSKIKFQQNHFFVQMKKFSELFLGRKNTCFPTCGGKLFLVKTLFYLSWGWLIIVGWFIEKALDLSIVFLHVHVAALTDSVALNHTRKAHHVHDENWFENFSMFGLDAKWIYI